MFNINDIIKEESKNGTEAMLIKNRLDKLFYEDRKTSDRYGLHASSIIASEDKFCYRQQVLSLFFEQNQGEQLPVKLLKIFAQGNAMHEKWYNLFRNAGIDVAIERTLFIEKYDLNFTIDAVLNILGEEYICDVKSMSTNTFTRMQKPAHPSGEKQILFYEWALSYYTKKPYKKGFVLIDDKNSQETAIVPVHYDKEKVMPFILRLREIQRLKKIYLNEKVLPECTCESCDCDKAQKCYMRDACWEIGKGRIKLDAARRKK